MFSFQLLLLIIISSLLIGSSSAKNKSKSLVETETLKFFNSETLKPHNNLEENFMTPPDSVKLWCYWYWLSGNVSKEGISKDLEAMAKVGIGEAFIGNIGMGKPYGKVAVLSKEWWELTEHAIREGKRTGVNIGIFNSPGWSQSGGPWIKSSQAMRYLLSSETKIKGGQRISEKLIAPADTFQDVAVIAFLQPIDDNKTIADLNPTITTSPLIKEAKLLFNNETQQPCFFPSAKSLSITIEVTQPFMARTLILYPAKAPFIAEAELQAYENGAYKTVRAFEYNRSNDKVNVGPISYGPVTISIPEITSTKFRLLLKNLRGKDNVQGVAEAPWKAGLTEISLSSAPRLERYIEKQLGKMFQTPLPLWNEYQWKEQKETGEGTAETGRVIDNKKILDLTKNMLPDGTLNWDAPAGKWIVMRIGVTPTGTKNSPASPEATGFEVDKMNRQHLEHHFDSYIGKILNDMPAEDRTAFKHVVADSYEMGSQNYTEGFATDFEKRFGYNPISWLPVLSGRIVGSANQSNRFLWDMRRFVADRVAYDYVGGLRDLSMKNGLRVWLENYGHWGFPSEFLMYGGQSNDLGGEFWTEGTLGNVECRAASSSAHTYGMNRVYAESYTGSGNSFAFYPARLKKRGDWSFTEGINHVLLHVYIHQPYEDKDPGMNAWFGTEFNRKNTWFDQSKIWFDYLRRNMFMLQQGKPVNDVCYFIGEDAPKMTGIRDPELPKGYSYDYINAEVIIKKMSTKGGRLMLPDGMSYRLLVLPPLETMRPEVLKKIKELVNEGAAVLGPRPLRSPSLERFPAADQEVQKLADELWGDVNGTTVKFRNYGKGIVMSGMDMESALTRILVLPDLELPKETPVLWVHRQIRAEDSEKGEVKQNAEEWRQGKGDEEIYFITNQSDKVIKINPVFRTVGNQPELWDATAGTSRVLPQYTIKDQRTEVPLQLEPAQSYFIVFRHPSKPARGVNFPKAIKIQTIKGPWQVQFDKLNRGPEKPVTFNTLTDWSTNSDERIRYYSGTAFYRNTFQSELLQKGERLLLKLSEVKNMARVKVNGHYVGGLWTAPLQLDITDAMIKGKNEIEIEVVNLWVNRLIGDSRLPVNERRTWLATNPFKPDSRLEPSGLIGDVELFTINHQ